MSFRISFLLATHGRLFQFSKKAIVPQPEESRIPTNHKVLDGFGPRQDCTCMLPHCQASMQANSFPKSYMHLPCTGESEFAGESASSIRRCWAASSPPSTFRAATCPAILLCHHKQVIYIVWSSARTFSVLLGLTPCLPVEQKSSSVHGKLCCRFRA